MDTLGAYCLPGDMSVRADVNKEYEVNEEITNLAVLLRKMLKRPER